MIYEHVIQLSCIDMINDLSDMATSPILGTMNMVSTFFWISHNEMLRKHAKERA